MKRKVDSLEIYVPSPKKKEIKFSDLDTIINEYFDANIMTDTEYQHRLSFCNHLNRAMQFVFPSIRLFIIGSSMNGTGTHYTDFDMCILTGYEFKRTETIYFLKKLSRFLDGFREINKKIVLRNARIPIIKFKNTFIDANCDISLNNAESVVNTYMIGMFSKLCTTFRKLSLWLKYWASMMKVNDASKGNLSSYCFTLLLLQFLIHEKAILPNLIKLFPEKFTVKSFANYDYNWDVRREVELAPDSHRLSSLFLDFIVYFEEFDFEKSAASILMGGFIERSEAEKIHSRYFPHIIFNREPALFIQDPITLANAARSFHNPGAVENLRKALTRTRKHLSKGHCIYDIFTMKK